MGLWNLIFGSNKSENPLAIIPDEKMKRELQEKILEIKNLFRLILTDSGKYKQEKIENLIGKMDGGFKAVFGGDDLLSLEEKKRFGLNTRQKFSRSFYEALSELGLKDESPKDWFESYYYQAFHIIHRKYAIISLKEAGIKKCKILSVNDGRDCMAIKNKRKAYNIEEVPELPLKECDADYCRCTIIASF